MCLLVFQAVLCAKSGDGVFGTPSFVVVAANGLLLHSCRLESILQKFGPAGV